MRPERFEYPDNAGYPDGTGFLDEGTASFAAESLLGDEPDVPSVDVADDIVVDVEASAYRAMRAGQEVAVMRVARDGTTVTLRTTVDRRPVS
jgi:uncharacterized protein